jgi:hypothetical protein
MNEGMFWFSNFSSRPDVLPQQVFNDDIRPHPGKLQTALLSLLLSFVPLNSHILRNKIFQIFRFPLHKIDPGSQHFFTVPREMIHAPRGTASFGIPLG